MILLLTNFGWANSLHANSKGPISRLIKSDTSRVTFTDSSKTSMEIRAGATDSGYVYRTIETTYRSAYIAPRGKENIKHYFAKYITTTKTCTGCEGRKRNIKIELRAFEEPSKPVISINRDCDDIILDVNYYKTITHGCCGAEDQHEIYDYDNQMIIAGDNKILFGSIPNSRVNVLIGFKNEVADSTTLGTLYLSYRSDERYEIRIKSSPLPAEKCSPFSPEISLTSKNPRNTFNAASNEHTLWSLDKINSSALVNGISIKVAFNCETELHVKPLYIPIINGMPFGKSSKNQEISYKYK